MNPDVYFFIDRFWDVCFHPSVKAGTQTTERESLSYGLFYAAMAQSVHRSGR